MKNIEDIKHINLDGKITKGCLALEGGAFRGIYTSGVLDYFLEHNLNLETAYGVSAGALNACNYMAGAFGRSALLILEHRFNPRYVGIKAFKESGSIIGFNFMLNDLNKEYPLNEKVLFSDKKTLKIVVANLKTGEADYYDNHDDHDIFYKAIRATASIPLVSKKVKINNQLYLDGGCVTKLPIKKALEDGNEKIIFVGTRDSSYRRKEELREKELIKIFYRKYPKFVKTFLNANKRYNEDCDLIDELVKQKKIYRITPSKPVEVGRLEKNIKKLSDLYYLGYNDAKDKFDEIIEFLNN